VSTVPDYEDQLARYQFQMGTARGRLARALDVLTDAIALTGQHDMYCHQAPASDGSASDLKLIMRQIEDSKHLIMETMEELKKANTG
jgi:hypothetical protein